MNYTKIWTQNSKNKRPPRSQTTRFDERKVKGKSLKELLSDFLLRMDYETNVRDFNKKILAINAVFIGLLSIIAISVGIYNGRLDSLPLILLGLWTLLFAAAYALTLLLIFAYFDIRMYRYTRQIEDYLPDFLQLAAANISAGMTVDRALWFAVRPKFGILAKEMEIVAKSNYTGDDLEKALLKFSGKYDSRILRETVHLLIAGLNSGGEIAGLLNRLAVNIKETQLMKKEISASVTTYAIFIGIATVIAAPVLFALSTELLFIIKKIFSSIQIDKSIGLTSLFSFNFSGESIAIENFKRFAILVLVISSFFSASIISVIRKGSVKDGLKTIPLFIGISIILYIVFSAAFRYVMGGLF